MKKPYYVKALWDGDANVWVSETNIPGLVIESDNIAEFERLVFDLAPEMLSANANIHDAKVPFEFYASARRELAVA